MTFKPQLTHGNETPFWTPQFYLMTNSDDTSSPVDMWRLINNWNVFRIRTVVAFCRSVRVGPKWSSIACAFAGQDIAVSLRIIAANVTRLSQGAPLWSPAEKEVQQGNIHWPIMLITYFSPHALLLWQNINATGPYFLRFTWYMN